MIDRVVTVSAGAGSVVVGAAAFVGSAYLFLSDASHGPAGLAAFMSGSFFLAFASYAFYCTGRETCSSCHESVSRKAIRCPHCTSGL